MLNEGWRVALAWLCALAWDFLSGEGVREIPYQALSLKLEWLEGPGLS